MTRVLNVAGNLPGAPFALVAAVIGYLTKPGLTTLLVRSAAAGAPGALTTVSAHETR